MAPVVSVSSILKSVVLSTSLLLSGARASPAFARDNLAIRNSDAALDKRDASSSPLLASRQNGGTFAITGTQNGGVQPRLKIQDLQNDADAWNLFVLAIQDMQQQSQSGQLSYYQLAAIHGRPLVPWDGVNGRQGAQNGYCTHTSNLFPTWHRPYLVLFEQVLGYAALDVANQFADKARWTAAAQRLRLPYLDWAAAPAQGQSVFPTAFSQPQIAVTQPDGTNATIQNPLYQYNFQVSPPTELFYSPWNTESHTLRWPTSADASASSQDNLDGQQLDSNRISARDRVYNLLTQYPDYANFSNEAWIQDMPPGGAYDSIESVHDAIHGILGGDNFGHMTYLDVAAFDPTFWVHHAMVDRIVAIWQALYPDTWTEPQVQKGATYTFASGSVQDANSPLTPFHSDSSGTFWTSNGVRDITQFGYTYPELANGADTDSIRAAINSLYGPSNSAQFLQHKRNTPEQSGVAKRDVTDNIPYQRNYEWLANIRAHKNICNETLFVHIFIGNHSSNPADWFTDPNSVGTHTIFARHSPTEFHVTGTLPITTALVDKIEAGELQSLAPSDVNPYLKQNLDWKVSKANGAALPQDHYPHIKISIVSSAVKPPATKYDFPQWVGDFSIHDDLTAGKLGGFSFSNMFQ